MAFCLPQASFSWSMMYQTITVIHAFYMLKPLKPLKLTLFCAITSSLSTPNPISHLTPFVSSTKSLVPTLSHGPLLSLLPPTPSSLSTILFPCFAILLFLINALWLPFSKPVLHCLACPLALLSIVSPSSSVYLKNPLLALLSSISTRNAACPMKHARCLMKFRRKTIFAILL